MKISKALKEVWKIREALYEKNKKLSIRELLENIEGTSTPKKHKAA